MLCVRELRAHRPAPCPPPAAGGIGTISTGPLLPHTPLTAHHHPSLHVPVLPPPSHTHTQELNGTYIGTRPVRLLRSKWEEKTKKAGSTKRKREGEGEE